MKIENREPWIVNRVNQTGARLTIHDTRFYWLEGDPQLPLRSRNWTCTRQVGDLLMPLPPAVLNYEEMHWQTTSVSLNQRHWLNHRNSVTNTAERDPPPRG